MFLLFGGLAFIIDSSILAFFHYGLEFGSIVSRFPAACASLIFTWYCNMRFTFQVKPVSKVQSFIGYSAVQGTGFCLNLAIYSFLVTYFDVFAGYVIFALAISTAIVVLFNFVLSALVFRST